MPAATISPDEFEKAFADHGRTLWLLGAAWVGREHAQDLVQETARVAWQRRAGFVPGTSLRLWLAQIARNIGANWRRRRHEAPWTDDVAEPVARPFAAAPWPFRAADHLSDDLSRALAGLPEAARACLLLHVIAEHTFAEIGAMLDLPPNTVASHVRRARLALRAALDSNAPPVPEPLPESP
ncbi:MAG: RNA polymerase sigma factor [Planctomycetes bacterium]|nr:RNA polymerase sigma factor [Planctomycetota bacterium]